MASELQNVIASTSLANGLTHYYPLDGGSTAGVVAGNPSMQVGGAPTANGPILAKGGAPSFTHNGSYHQTPDMSLGTLPPNAVSVNAIWRATAYPAAGQFPGVFGFNNGINLQVGFRNPGASVRGSNQIVYTNAYTIPEVWQINKTYMSTVVYSNNEIFYYFCGKLSRRYAVGPVTKTNPVKLGAPYLGFTGQVGHIGAWSRALSAGEINQMWHSTTGEQQVFTDVWDKVQDGIPKTVTVSGLNKWGRGKPIKATDPKPGLPIQVDGNSVVIAKPADVKGYCASIRCHGAIRGNEAHITLTDGRPIHVGCMALDQPGVQQPYLSQLAGNPTPTQYQQILARLAADHLAVKGIKTSPGTSHYEKGHYLAVNERDFTQVLTSADTFVPIINATSNTPPVAHPGHSTGHGAFAVWDSQQFGLKFYYTYSGIAAQAAFLHRYYNMPKNSWLQRYAEVIIDFMIAQWQNANGSWTDGNSDDFFFASFGMTVKLLAPYLSKTKFDTWAAALEKQAKITVADPSLPIRLDDTETGSPTPTSGFNDGFDAGRSTAFYNINANRNLANMHGIWMTYLVTGNPRWRRVFEMQYKIFFGGMPAVGQHAAPPPAGTYLTTPNPTTVGAVAGDWPQGLGTNAWNSMPQAAPNIPYGASVTQGATLDGSDSIVLLGESRAPGNPVGYDQNYSIYQLHIINAMLPWVNYDERFVFMANGLLNSIWPYVDQIGGRIKELSTGNVQTNPSWCYSAEGGSRSYGYIYDAFPGEFLYTAYVRGLKTAIPATAPTPNTYGGVPYSNYSLITPAMLKSNLIAYERERTAEYGGQMITPEFYRKWNKPQHLINDPSFICPTTPGGQN